MTQQTTGEQLKQARLKAGLSLEQASQATHIRLSYLEALENNQRDSLPSAVQARGFLRMYAELLHLSTSDILAAWDGKSLPQPPAPPVLPSANEIPHPEASPSASQLLEEQPSANPETPEPVAVAAPEVPRPPDGKSQVIFQEIGALLHSQRESLGLSLVEVERYTRLRQHYILAMEEGRIDRLPSPVQGRGMLSNYASFLNLDEDKLLLRFAEGLMARRVERIPAPEPQAVFSNKKRPARQAPFWRRFLTPDLLFGVVVAAIILFFSLWTLARINNLRVSKSQPTPPGVAEMLLKPQTSITLTGTLTTLTPRASAVAGVSENLPEPSQTPVPSGQALIGQTVTPAPGTLQAAMQSTGAVLPAGATATIAPINKDPLQIYIIARQRAWLRIITDDKIKFLGRTVPGNAYAFSATKRLELLTGDASAIQVFYNQKDMGTLGTEAQVVGLVFVPEGIFTPTAAFTPTATATKLATPTLLPTLTPLASPTITPYIPTK